MNGNTVVTTVTLNEDNGWAATVQNLPKKANGTDITYTWSEGSMPEGYSLTDTSVNGKVTTLTNKYAPEETSVSVRKVWADNDNQDGIRTAGITVQLYADGKNSGDPVELNAANNWSHTWTKLAKNANKTAINYTVDEVSVPSGYTKTVTANEGKTEYTITNTHTTETTEATVRKVWNDSNDQDGKRPKSLSVNLMNGNTVVDTVTLTADNNWTATVQNLPKKANGTDITYTWSEGSMPEGYSLTDTSVNGKVTTLTNTYVPETVNIEGTKSWNDGNNQDGKRPTSITVKLLANGDEYASQTVTPDANGNWKYSFTNVPKYANGQEITYTVEETEVDGYTSTVKGYDITNTYTPETTEVSGTKTWDDNDNQDGKRPTSITVNLYANGVYNQSKEVSADASGNWTYSFTDLPKYENGVEITYTVTETAVPGYKTSIKDYDITNSHTPETTKVEGIKTWKDAGNQDGKRPEKINVILLANGKEAKKQEVSEATSWKYSFDDLPKYANGQEIVYTVTEENVEGYTTEYDTAAITNSYTPGKTSATVKKIWNDANNQDGKRPTSITVRLYANEKATETTAVLNADNNWSATVADLDEKANGKAI